MADLKKLLNKRGWTGRELGIIAVEDLAIRFQELLAGEPVKGIVSNTQLSKMIHSIKDPAEGQVYNGYLAIYDWLTMKYNIAQTQFQQAQLQFRTIEGYITHAIVAEDVYGYISSLPYIVTQKQLEDMQAERREQYFKGEDGEELYSNVFNLVERYISHFLHLLSSKPSAANPLKAIRKKYISQPVKSKLILSRWNEIEGEGYYQLEDGRRSDQMSYEEWQEALYTPKMKEVMEELKVKQGGGEKCLDLAQKRYVEHAKILFHGGTDKEAEEAQNQREYEEGLRKRATWHTKEEPPEDLTKWDFIEQEVLLNFYPASLDGEDEYTEANFTASMRDFVEEFPELVELALKDMQKHFFSKAGVFAFPADQLVDLTTLPLEKWEETIISWRDLYNMGFYSMEEEANEDINTFDGNPRACFNGIAVLRPSDICGISLCIDEQGYFKEPDIRKSLNEYSLEGFFPESESYAENVEILENARHMLLYSVYFLKGFKLALDMTAEYYDIPHIYVFMAELERVEQQVDALNSLVAILYRKIKDTSYQDKELQARKLEVLKDFFREIDLKEADVPEENIQQARELIKGFKAYKGEYATTFYDLLCTMPDPAEDEEEGE